jgi:hypothetical protein
MKIKLIFALGVIALLAGCSNVLNPPEAPAGKAGTVAFTVDQGAEARTVFPSLSQFSKVALTFVGSPAVEEAIVSGGSVTLNLPQGSWNVTAKAYIGDVLAAQSTAHSIAWTGSGDVSGETRFVLVPTGSGNGTLRGVVAPPAGITLGALSRIAIEGQADMPVSGAMEGEVSLPAGRYYVDVVLENAKTGATAVYRRIVVILSGLTTEIRFAPAAAEFLSGEARAALSSVEGLVFGPTANNAAGIAVDDDDQMNGNIRIAAPGGTTELHFTVYNPNALTLTAAKATWVSSAEGSTSSANLSVFKVDTSALNGNNGAELDVTITAAEQSREGVPITVTVTLAPTFTDLGELTTYFAGLAPNTAASSYAVKLEGFNLGAGDLAALGDPLGKVYRAAGQKYFSLDLSGCTGNLGNVAASSALKTRLASLVLPDDLTSIGANVFSASLSLASVTLPDTLTSIGTGAFMNCRTLESVILPNSLTTLGNDAFRECHSLLSVAVPGSVTTLGNYAFAYCYSLESVTLNAGLETIGIGVFSYDGALADINFPAGLKTIGDSAFANCGALASVVFPASLETIAQLAFNSSGLTSVVLPEGLTTLADSFDGGAFAYTPIVSVVLPSTLKRIGARAFSNCYSLVSVTIPEGVETIGSNAFMNDSRLVSVALPTSVTTIEGSAFYLCRSLESINLSAVTSLEGSAFLSCDSLSGPITLSSSMTSVPNYLFQNCASLTGVTLPAGIRDIGASAFNGCVSLASVNLPEGLEGIGNNAFSGCVSLSATTLPASVNNLGTGIFSGVSGTIAIAPGNATYELLEGSALIAKSAPATLKEYYGGGNADLSGITQLTTVGPNAFTGNSNITGITFHQNVTTISGIYAFQNCTALTTITAPGAQTISGLYAFQNCTALTTVSLPGLTTLSRNYAFQNCTSLTTVSLPKLTTLSGAYVFQNCTALISVSLLALTSVGSNVFNTCTFLTTITLPATLTSIGAGAFANCSNLVSVTIERTTPPTVNASSFNNTAAGLKIYVPAANLDTYKAASVWSTTYLARLEAIPSI